MTQVAIYALCEPGGSIRYIGKSQNPQKRLLQHLAEARSNIGGGHRLNWLRQLLAQQEVPDLRVLHWVADTEWREWERSWIATLLEAGYKLVNDTVGGDGRVGPLSELTKSRLSAAHNGRAVNPLGVPLRESHRRNISISLIGNKHLLGHIPTEETRRKISAGVKQSIASGRKKVYVRPAGWKMSAEGRANVATAMKRLHAERRAHDAALGGDAL